MGKLEKMFREKLALLLGVSEEMITDDFLKAALKKKQEHGGKLNRTDDFIIGGNLSARYLRYLDEGYLLRIEAKNKQFVEKMDEIKRKSQKKNFWGRIFIKLTA